MQTKSLYCRNCDTKTQHRRILKYDWGYSCNVCQTWQHQSILAEILKSYAAQIILDNLVSKFQLAEPSYCDGTIEEFIEAAHALNMEFDYHKNRDGGYDFMAWNLDDEQVAKIIL